MKSIVRGFVSSPPVGSRVVALDGLRGFAIGLVLARHALPAQIGGGGFAGVDLFFVLSGFLITTLLIEEHTKSGHIMLGKFYARRALRLLPALYFMLAVYAVVLLVFAPAAKDHLSWLGFAAVYATPFAQWNGAEIAPGLGVVWSLAVEEYFYFLWPLLFMAMLALKLPKTARYAIPVALAILFMAIRVATWFQHGTRIYEMPWTWIDGLLAGCLTAMLWKGGLIKKVPAWAYWSAFTLIVAFSFFPNAKGATFTYVVALPLLAVCSAIVVASLVTSSNSKLAALLTFRPLRWLGTRSYAIYLWNAIFLSAAKPFEIARPLEVGGGIVLSLLIAEISFRLVEKPALKYKKRFERASMTTNEVESNLISAPAVS